MGLSYLNPREVCEIQCPPSTVLRTGEASLPMKENDYTRESVPKVLVYVVADGHLLVNWHCHHPEAGIQVPGGTIEAGETAGEAAVRELFEESGMVVAGPAKLLHQVDFLPTWDTSRVHDRHFVMVQHPSGSLTPFMHQVSSGTLDKGILLAYFWVPIAVASEILGSGHGAALSKLQLV